MSGAHEASSLIALAGLPNCGKTSLFNALTGSRQKVANYPGVTVERKEGVLPLPDGRTLRVLDLPGTYSLDARTPDEAITRDVLLGRVRGEDSPALLIAVADATNLERNLGLVLDTWHYLRGRPDDALLDAAARTADPAARFALFQKAEAILVAEAPFMPLYHHTHVFLIQPSVKGWHANLLDHHPYKHVWLEN